MNIEVGDALGMLKYRSSSVQQVIYAELDASFHDPAQRAVMVVGNIIDQKWVVKSIRFDRDQRGRR